MAESALPPPGRRLLYLSGSARASTLPDAATGGARSHILGVIAGFRAQGYDVERFILGDLVPAVRTLSSTSMSGSLLRRLALDFGRLLTGLVARPFVYLRYRNYPDLVYERYAVFQVLGLAFARRGVPWILETQSVDFQERTTERGSLLFTSLARRLEARAYRKCDVLVCVSPTLRDSIIDTFSIDADKVIAVPMAYDAERFKPLPKAAAPSAGLRIVFVGEIIRRHRIDLLIHAIAAARELDREGPGFELRIAGEGPARESLEGLVSELQLGDRVEFVGRLKMQDVPAFLSQGDLGYVGHADTGDSRAYSSPTKLYEYMAMQKPVIAAGADDVQGLVREGETGFLFRPGDAGSLNDALTRAWRHRSRLEAMGRNARTNVETEHTWEMRVAGMLQRVDAILNRSRGAAGGR
jgi:glycosyltransferase involved in cell wall biosynthesis